MRLMNIFAALSGAAGLTGLALASHAARESPYVGFAYLASAALLSAGAAGLAVANRSGRLNALAGAFILGGAWLFAGEIVLSFSVGDHPLNFLAPIGGAAMIAGWITLAFAKPG